MTLSVQEMSDRFEIQDLLVGYCHAVDTRSFDALDTFFTADAMIDYTEMVGVKGGLAEIKAFLRQSFAGIVASQHAVSTTRYEIDGDRATTKTVCSNPMVVDDGGVSRTIFFGLWYIHDYVRTPQGWRISRLYEEKCFDHNVPDWVKAMTW